MAEPIKDPSMNDPSQNVRESQTREQQKQSSAADEANAFQQQPKVSLDPAGVWSKFLSQTGTQATPEEVNLFLQSLEKMFNVLIQQNQAAFKRSMDKLKESQ